MDRRLFTVGEGLAGARLDAALCALCPECTRSFLQRRIQAGDVLVNGKAAPKSLRLAPGDAVALTLPPPAPLELPAQDIPLDIVYEDAHLLVINKPKGMVVHPAPGNESGTLVNALLCHCGESLSGINGVCRPGIVHRIDKDTSGLLVVAKTDAAHASLAAQIAAHSFKREYQAVVYGRLGQETGVIDAPIGRHPVDRKRMAVTDKGRWAVTHYRVLAGGAGFSHLSLALQTGRTHQIRVHMAHIGHPVAGDPVYGPKKVLKELGGQCLHAKTIAFIHPATGRLLEFESPLPAYFETFLASLSLGQRGTDIEEDLCPK